MVLTFLTSLRHPSSSNDYARVEALLARTLRGLDAQVDRRCRVVVVANEQLELPAGLSIEVRRVQVGFPAPALAPNGRLSIDQVRRDKGTKLAVGLGHVNDGHVMLLDADDYVSRDLTGFVAASPAGAGWFIDDGLMYDSLTGLSVAVPRFNTVCGSSLIVRRDLLPVVELGASPHQEDVVRSVGEDTVIRWLGSHRFLAQDLHLLPLPFVGAVYDVNNGENHSGTTMSAVGRPLWPTRAAQFGIVYDRPLTVAARATTVLARRALVAAARRGRRRLWTGS